jgi:hypothetical protein
MSRLPEETIEALSRFDLERMLTLEERTMLLVRSGVPIGQRLSVLEKRNRPEREPEERN